MESEFYDEGWAAHAAGYPKDACPYKAGTGMADDWTRGWVDADDADGEEDVD